MYCCERQESGKLSLVPRPDFISQKLHSCQIKSGSGVETRLWEASMMLTAGLVCFYECTIWSCLQVSYILLREAYIANTRNHTSGTSGDSDKCNSFIHIQGNELCAWKTSPSYTCTYTHDTRVYTHMHTSSYVDETFSKIRYTKL